MSVRIPCSLLFSDLQVSVPYLLYADSCFVERSLMERSGMIKSAAILEQIGSGIEGCNDKRIWLAIAELLFQSD
jgi:hypothetical protein